MRLLLSFCLALFFCAHRATLFATEYPDQDGDGFIDIIEDRYASFPWAASEPEEMPAHGVPIMIGQTEGVEAVQRFPELDNAVAIDAGGLGTQQYVLILLGSGRVASWSLFGDASIEEKLYVSGDWIGTHPRQWEGVLEIEVAPFGLFGIGADGAVSMCGEPWAVNAVESFGDLREIETSYNSLIVVAASGQVETATDGSWTAPVVPDLTSSPDFAGMPGGVAAGKETFWVLGSIRGVKGWGTAAEIAKMDYSAFEDVPLSRMIVSPSHAAGLAVPRIGFSVPFGVDASGTPLNPAFGSFTPTPGEGSAFSSLSNSGYHTTAALEPSLPTAPGNWWFYQLASSDSALFGILRDGTPLEWAVADALGAPTPSVLDANDWQNPQQLDLSGLPISSLDGIERATQLEILGFEGTTIRDLSPLENLDWLTELNAARTPVLDLSPIADRQFASSSFADTTAAEVEATLRTAFAYQMRRIYADFFARNEISVFSSNIQPPAWWHSFDASLLELIRFNAPALPLNLVELSVVDVLRSTLPETSGLRLTSLRGVELLGGLEELTVPNQAIVDISDLADLPLLERVDLSNNPVVDLSALLRLRKLNSLDISDTGAAEILDAAPEEMPVRQQLVEILAELTRRGVSVTRTSSTARDDWQLHFEEQTAAAIRDELGSFDHNLTLSDLDSLRHLWPHSENFEITDLSGLQYAWRIQEIHLEEQNVSDLEPLADLPYLSRLYIRHYFNEDRKGRVADLSPLAGHPGLEHIEFNGSNVLDLSPLLDLPRLDHLELNDTFIAELVQAGDAANPAVQLARKTVAAFEARGVSVYLGASPRDDWWRVFEPALGRALRDEFINEDVRLSDIENVPMLFIDSRGVADLSGMELFYQLEAFNLRDNFVCDLGALSQLPNLRSLNLANNPVVDLKPLLQLASLQDVDLSGTSATDLVQIAGNYPPAIKVRLDLAALAARGVLLNDTWFPRNDWWRHIAPDLTPHLLEEFVSGAYQIEMNDLMGLNNLTSVSDLLPLIDDLSGIQFAMALENLTLADQQISDLSPLSQVAGLQSLDLSNSNLEWPSNRVSDLQALLGLAQLDRLDLANNDVLELEPLVSLPELNWVTLDGTFAAELIANGAPDNPYAQRARAWSSSFQGTLNDAVAVRTDWWRIFDPALGGELIQQQAAGGDLTLTFLEELESFSAPEKGIFSIEHIALLYTLETLQLSSNPISDLSPLVELPGLQSLSLDWVGEFAGTVPDIEPLGEMRNLRFLDLSDNPLLAIEPFLNLPFLESVNLENTYVEDQPENPSQWIVSVLRNRGVAVTLDTQERFDWSWLFEYPLATAINTELGRPAGSGFSHDELLQLTQLNAAEAGIKSIAGLELAANLEQLYLANNSITDLAPLESLTKLTDLGLSTDTQDFPQGNLFRDLRPLENLWSLQDLDLSGTAATDFSLLAKLPSLNSIHLRDTLFDANSDLGERLSTLGISVSTGGTVDASRLLAPSLYQAIARVYGSSVDLNRSDLTLNEQGIDSLEGIGIFRRLETLSLTDNEISDLSPLRGMPELREIDVSDSFYEWFIPGPNGNAVRDISVLASLPKLEVFQARANMISNISPLLECLNLQNLDIEDNFVLDQGYSGWSPDTFILRQLEARGVYVQAQTSRDDWYLLFPDPTLAQSFSNYRSYDFESIFNLEINGTVRDLSGLDKFFNLQNLILRDAQVQDLSPLAELRGLTILNLDRTDLGDHNLLSDLSPLAGLTGLDKLSLQNQGLRDLSLLAELPGLSQADLSGNLLDLRPESVASILIDDLDERITFILGAQRDIWNTIADAGLERAIRDRLNLLPDEAITQLHWENLRGLLALGFGIEDISELALANNLVGLNLMGNQVTDASSLSGLKNLQSVGLDNSDNFPEMHNQIDDLSVFENNENLRLLHLDGHQITDVSPLLGMRNLERLNLDGNPLDLREGSDTVRLLTVLAERGTLVRYDDRYRTGKSDGIEAVESNPQAYSLFTEEQLRALAVGKPTLELDENGAFQLKLDVYESPDLIEWFPGNGSFEEVGGQFIWKPSNPGDTKFYIIEAQ